MIPNIPLTDNRARAIFHAFGAPARPGAFVAVTPHEAVEGHQGQIGFAIANLPGYAPVPAGWASYAKLSDAEEAAEAANKACGVSSDDAMSIVISTMGGQPFFPS